MIISGQSFEQIVITRKGSGRLTTDGGQEVIAVLSDDGEWIVKNGYEIQTMPAPYY
jgi:hypothetical protein